MFTINRLKLILLPGISIFLLIVIGLTGCSQAAVPAGNGLIELRGTINEAGSTSVQPLAEMMAKAFMQKYPDVTVNISGGGSSAGVKAVAAGTVDIGAVSREILINEPDLITYCIARDGVAIVVHESNALTGINIENVAKIYAGEITNWKEVGGADERIVVISREEGSGTREVFDEFVIKPYHKKIKAGALFFDSNGAIRTKVSSEKNAIGYLSFGYIEGLKPLMLNNVAPTVENVQNGRYPIVRRLYFITKNIPSEPVRSFIDYCRSNEGQKIVESQGYIPIVKK
jgi:phosphate transport system substrate-binding protein